MPRELGKAGNAVMNEIKHVQALGGSEGEAEARTDAAWLTEAARAIYAMLSPKERAVLLAAARGAEDKEIAVELGCTLSTVRTLWQRTYKKTRTVSRRRLIAAIWERACHLASRHFLNDVTDPLE